MIRNIYSDAVYHSENLSLKPKPKPTNPGDLFERHIFHQIPLNNLNGYDLKSCYEY